jgi:solute carrier family 25 (mitochondrial S-adenosylmethionine transporter), member 26
MIARNLPSVALQFPLFEYLRSRSHITTVPEGEGRKYVWDVVKHNAVSAGLAAGMASIFTNPIDLVKTKVMLQATKHDGHDGYREMIRKIWREEGMKGFWRGGGMRVAWMAVGAGTYLGTYQGAKVWLGGEPETGDTEELL